MNETFTSCDANNDERLNKAEFEDFLTKLEQNSQLKILPFQPYDQYSAEEKEAMYAFFNSKSENDGIPFQKFFDTAKEVQAKVAELSGQRCVASHVTTISLPSIPTELAIIRDFV